MILQVIIFGLLLAVLGIFQYQSIKRDIYKEAELTGRLAGQIFREMITENEHTFEKEVLSPLLLKLTSKLGNVQNIEVIDSSARIKASSDMVNIGNVVDEQEILKLLDEYGDSFLYKKKDGQNQLRVAMSLEGHYDKARKSNIIGVIYFDLNLNRYDATILWNFSYFMLLIALFLMALLATGYYLITQGFTRRIGKIMNAAYSLVKGEYAVRTHVTGGDEITELALTFNNIAGVLQKSRNDLISSIQYTDNIINTMTNSLVIVSSEGAINYVNPATRSLLGYEGNKLIGQHIGIIFADAAETMPFTRTGIEKFFDKGVVRNLERTYLAKDGTQILVNLSMSVMRKDRDIQGIVCIAQDINELKKAEKAIGQAKEAAEAASRFKSKFLSNMSHEIRTPITGIMGMTDLVLRTNLTSQQREYLAMLQNSANALLTLINDILVFSEIEVGRLKLDSYEFRLRDCIDSAIKTVSIDARKKGLELLCSVAPDVPDHLIGDAGRLKQVLLNLLSNAIKFTDRGEVVVEVRDVRERVVEQTDGSNGQVASSKEKPLPHDPWHLTLSSLISDCALQFSVRDTGIAIPAEKLKSIFESFVQADSSFSRRYGGTGLGLSISSGIVRLMGGSIWVESKAGKGSTFHFTAQFGLCTEWEDSLVTATDIKNIRVLVVDGDETGRMIIREMLANCEIKPVAVESGRAAMEEMFYAVAEASPYRMVLIDAVMPDMDGLALISEIKKNPVFNETAILMLSPANVRYDHAHFREMGISYLTKPVNQSDLLNKIMRLLSTKVAFARNVSKAREEKKSIEPIRSLHILLTEDNAVNQYLTMSFLMEAGHKVKIANNGREAVNAMEKEEYDLILMDVQMPVMDGFQATTAIREKEKTTNRHIPIIAMTALAMKGDRERCFEAGMDEYVSKPIDRDELFRTIGDVIKTNHPYPMEGEVASEVIDIPVALLGLQGNKKLLKEISGMFLDELPKYLAAIQEAVQQGDSHKLDRASHTLKGAVGNFAATSSFEAAHAIEMIGKSGDLAGAEKAIAGLFKEIEKLKPVLEKIARNEF